MTKLSDNYMNLESWLSEIPIGEIEVILVHDVQDVETAPILNRILTKINDDKIKYFERSFGAPGLTRNFGMTAINSEWMWFVDADDLPNIENVLQELKSIVPDVEMIIGQFQIDSNGDKTAMDPSHELDFRAIARDPGIWRMVFRTTAFMDYKFQEFRMAEDQLFLIDANVFERKTKFSEKISKEVNHMAETGYCVKCKSKKEMKDSKEVTMKNKRKAMKGKCPACGTGMYRILGK